MDADTIADEFQRVRQIHQIPEVIGTDIPETPVRSLHLAVSPAALVFSNQVFQVVFFISTDDIFFYRQYPIFAGTGGLKNGRELCSGN